MGIVIVIFMAICYWDAWDVMAIICVSFQGILRVFLQWDLMGNWAGIYLERHPAVLLVGRNHQRIPK